MKRLFWKLKEEAPDRTLWRTRCGKGYGPALRQTAEWIYGFLRLDITTDSDLKKEIENTSA
jgi:hypothetical protein